MNIVLIVSIGILLLLVILWFAFRRMKGSPIGSPSTTYSKLVLGDGQHPFAEIERFTPTVSHRQEALPISQRQLSRLSAIFQHAPNLASSAFTAESNIYVLRFAPEVAADIANGSLTVMQSAEGGLRGIAVNSQGTIVAHGSLIQPSGIQLAAVATAVWHGLALVTAQHYLSEIDRRLLHIEQGINEIKKHLETHDIAILLGNLTQLKSLRFLLNEPEFQEAELLAGIVSLDTIDRECGQVLAAYRHHMTRYATEFDTQTLASLFGADFTGAIEKATQYERAARICLQAIYVKGVAAQLRCVIPSDRRIAHHRLQELETDLNMWYADQVSFTNRFKKRIQDDTTPKIPLDGLKKLLGVGKTYADYQKEIIDGADRAQVAAIALHGELNHMIASSAEYTAKQLSASSQPLALVVKLNEQNQIEQISRVIEE